MIILDTSFLIDYDLNAADKSSEIMFYDADKIAREQTEMRIEIITEKGKIKAKA